MLLVDDGQAEAGERHGFAKERVRPDDDWRLPRGDEVVRVGAVAGVERARQQQDVDPDTLQQRADRVPMLPREEIGRR